MSIDIDEVDANETGVARIVSGTPGDLIAAASNEGRILNALSLLSTRSNSSIPSWIATCQVAWENTANTVFNTEVRFPMSDIYWSVAATAGASTFWHKDACGLATAVHCNFGQKVWLFRRRDQSRDCQLGHILSDSFHPEGPLEGSEAIVLDNRTTM